MRKHIISLQWLYITDNHGLTQSSVTHWKSRRTDRFYIQYDSEKIHLALDGTLQKILDNCTDWISLF